MGFQTNCTVTGENRETYQGAAAPPICSASTFAFDSYEAFSTAFGPAMEGYGDAPVYTRGNNPTVQVLERKVALLEGADEARAFGSGMAAIAAAVLSAAKSGDHVVAVQSVYANAFRLLNGYLPKLGISTTFADFSDLQTVQDAITDRTRVLYLESPGNPAMDIVDLPEVAALAREHGLLTIIDNTMATPFNQRPIELGIDMVVHSATKYLAGHGDVVAGIVAGSSDRMRGISGNETRDLGGIIGPFEAWLVLRGIRTLGLRMRAHNEAGMHVACQLVEHPRVQRVLYPGLPSHPQYDLAQRQMRGFGGLLSVVLEGGMEAAIRFADNLRLFGIAVSWGGFESLVLPINPEMTHSPDICRRLGIVPGMVRLSVGLEDVEDLQDDLCEALRAAYR